MSTDEISDLEEARLRKAADLRQRGLDPYPPRVTRSHTVAEARAAFESAEATGQQLATELALAGRLVMSIRSMGKLTFAHLADGTGRIQLAFKQDAVGPEAHDFFKRDFDVGDFVAVRGTVFRTRTGEITVQVSQFQMLAKALHPLPEKWHGLKDVEARYRQRYLDLLVNEEARRIFLVRSQMVTAMRRFLDSRGFVEVETPILQPLYGGAAARPFETYHNALDRMLYLRIANELYLKRLIIGGLDKVYEIGKDFRNEGIDTKHNPEFTQMECYQAYADYTDMMRLTEEMVAFIAQEVMGTTRITFQGQIVELAPPWRRLPLRQAIQEYGGVDIEAYPTLETLWEQVKDLSRDINRQPTWGKLVDELLKELVEPNLIQPAFVIDYPIEISPLAKRKPEAPHLVERFEVFIGTMECGNAFTELNDPIDQLERFQEQAAQRAAGDEETHPVDEDFVQALKYGMPPTGGLGMGIDRLTMLLTDQVSIREVILFPQLRAPGSAPYGRR